MDKLLALFNDLWTQLTWVEALMASLPFIPLFFYMWVIHQFRKAGKITDTYNSADKIAFSLYLASIPIAIFIHLYFKLGPFVSFFIVWILTAVIVKLIWKFVEFMAAREKRNNRAEYVRRMDAIRRENRRKRGW